jgi:hypothetical protein
MQQVIEESKWANEALYLYNNDTQNIYARTIAPDDWLRDLARSSEWREKHAKNHYPPILSNLGIEVEQPEDDWRREREKKVVKGSSTTASEKSTKLSDF